jgi:hypothetical protein
VRALPFSAKLTWNNISKFGRGVREPSISTLLKYAKAVGLTVEVLIDEDLKDRSGTWNGRRGTELNCEQADEVLRAQLVKSNKSTAKTC